MKIAEYFAAFFQRHATTCVLENRDLFINIIKEAQQEAIHQQWQPIETAPKDGSYIIAFIDDEEKNIKGIDVVKYSEVIKRFSVNAIAVRITHWQPLPPAPKESK